MIEPTPCMPWGSRRWTMGLRVMPANASIQNITTLKACRPSARKRGAPEAQYDLGGLKGRRSSATKPTMPRSPHIADQRQQRNRHPLTSPSAAGYQFVLCGCQRSPGCFPRRVDRLHRVLNLLEGAGLDLAYALPAHAEFGGEICQGHWIVCQAACLETPL